MSTSQKYIYHRLRLGLIIWGITVFLGLALTVNAQGPIIENVKPTRNTFTSTVTSNVSITYNQPIDASTVSTQTFVVHAMQTGVLTQVYQVEAGTITLNPTHPFKWGEFVQVNATTQTLNLNGVGPASPTVWQFHIKPRGGSTIFASNKQDLGLLDSTTVDLGDVDGDGDVDAFVGNASGQPNILWLNNGDGTFTMGNQLMGNASTWGVKLGDLDSDGDLDVFWGNCCNEPNRVWFNDGEGTFVNSDQTLGNSDTYAVDLGDVDGDGDLDALIGNNSEDNGIWLNDGTGIFTDTGQALGDLRTLDVALRDLDNDGDLDAVIANYGDEINLGEPNEVWLNDGSGIFTWNGQELGESLTYALDVGDIDGDGDLDIINANDGGSNVAWINNGFGFFLTTGQSIGFARSTAVALGDLDGDNDLDAFVGNCCQFSDEVWLNNSSGFFTNTGQTLGNANTRHVALGDLDGDGDLDAFGASYLGVPNTVWLNQNAADLRIEKTVWPDNPAPPVTAITYTLTYANYGFEDIPDVIITDLLPSNLTNTSYQSSQPISQVGGSDYTWLVGDLGQDEGGVITITGVFSPPLTGGLITNTALITSSTPEDNPDNNLATAVLAVKNIPPVANPATYVTDEDTLVTDTLTASDVNNDTLTYQIVITPSQGHIILNNMVDGTFIYTPSNQTSSYQDTFTFLANDGIYTSTASVTITVTADNDVPDAIDDRYSVGQNSSTNALSVLDNDINPDIDEHITIIAVGTPNISGTVSINNDASGLLYTPATDFTSTETFTYTIIDNLGSVDTALVTVTIDLDNTPPLANDDTFTVNRDSISNTLNVLQNDSDPNPGDTYTITVVGPTNRGGVATTNGLTITYTPLSNFIGTETFTYTIADNLGSEDTALVTVTITGLNQPPVAVDDMVTVATDMPTSLNILGNDSDANGNTLIITALGTPASGAIVNHNLYVIYTSAPGFTGSDSFTYTISDGQGEEASAEVFVTVTESLPASPLAVNKSVMASNGTNGTAYLGLGDTVIYTINLSNTSETTTTGILLTDMLPQSLTFDSWLESNTAQLNDNHIAWWGELAAGETLRLQFTAVISNNTTLQGQTITNTVEATTDGNTPINDSAAFTVTGSNINRIYLPVILK